MPAIVEYPQVVAGVVDRFADLFPNAPQRRHFAEYLTGALLNNSLKRSEFERQLKDPLLLL